MPALPSPEAPRVFLTTLAALATLARAVPALRRVARQARESLLYGHERRGGALERGEEEEKKTKPRGIDLMIARNRKMNSDASVKNGRGFQPRASDVFITTYAKCGTTWTMQILQQLRSGGDMEFEEITEAIPWDVLAMDCGQNLDDDQKYQPRCFKSHEQWQHIAKGGRYVYVARHPEDAMLSFLKFLPKWMCVPETMPVTVEEFVDAIFAGASNSGLIWNHFAGWYSQRNNPNVLWLFFEDLKADLRTSVLRIAKFLGMQPNKELVDLVVKMSHFSYMKEEQSKFDDHFVFNRVKKQMGLEGFAHRATKVRKSGGKVGEGKQALPKHILDKLSSKWEMIMTAQTGLKTYSDLREAIYKAYPEYYEEEKLMKYFKSPL